MSSQFYNDSLFSPVSKVSKRPMLPSSSPLSSLFGAKRTKLTDPEPEGSQEVSSLIVDFEGSQDVSSSIADFTEAAMMLDGTSGVGNEHEGGGDTPNGKIDFIVISSDPPTAEEDSGSVWSMHTATSESGNEVMGSKAINIAPSIENIYFHRGLDRRIGEDDYPSIIYINLKNGKVYHSAVDRVLLFLKRDLSGFEDGRALWLQTNIYIGDLFDQCVNLSTDPFEAFPILHRHGNHLSITREYLTQENNAPYNLKSSVDREWNRLVLRYGDFNDLQNEQRALVDKAFCLLQHYQQAIASRDLLELMKIDSLLSLLRDAFSELTLNEYVIRELFHRDAEPAFLTAIV